MMGEEDSPIQMNPVETTAIPGVLSKVLWMMTVGLLITGITSLVLINIPELLIMTLQTSLIWIIAEFALVVFLSAKITTMRAGTSTVAFVLYAIVNGITLSTIFFLSTEESLASAFFITAGMFGGVALYATITKKDFSGLGTYLVMALWGLILASVVNLFLHNSAFSFGVAVFGVVLFTVLTAYDVQKIKQYSEVLGTDNSENTKKLVVYGALMLYLDFINIFLKLVRIMGRARSSK